MLQVSALEEIVEASEVGVEEAEVRRMLWWNVTEPILVECNGINACNNIRCEQEVVRIGRNWLTLEHI